MDPAKLKAQAAYNAAAPHFDDTPLHFWERIGVGTVERLSPPVGGRILDVGCGTGASAITCSRPGTLTRAATFATSAGSSGSPRYAVAAAAAAAKLVRW